jgi:small subunit ribosomal protein S15
MAEATAKPEWMKMSAKEVEKLIVDLGKEGNTPEKIGLILRDKHGIPKAKLLGKKISTVLKNAGVKYDTLKEVQQKRIASLENHIKSHQHDTSAKRSHAKRMWVVYKLAQ